MGWDYSPNPKNPIKNCPFTTQIDGENGFQMDMGSKLKNVYGHGYGFLQSIPDLLVKRRQEYTTTQYK